MHQILHVFYNLDINKNIAWDLKVCFVLVQKNLNELRNICSFFHLLYALSFMYAGIYFSQIHTLPLKALLFQPFIIWNMIFSLLFLIALWMNLHSFLYYWAYSPRLILACIFCSVCAIQGFSATKQHVEDMKTTFIHEKAKGLFMHSVA